MIMHLRFNTLNECLKCFFYYYTSVPHYYLVYEVLLLSFPQTLREVIQWELSVFGPKDHPRNVSLLACVFNYNLITSESV